MFVLESRIYTLCLSTHYLAPKVALLTLGLVALVYYYSRYFFSMWDNHGQFVSIFFQIFSYAYGTQRRLKLTSTIKVFYVVQMQGSWLEEWIKRVKMTSWKTFGHCWMPQKCSIAESMKEKNRLVKLFTHNSLLSGPDTRGLTNQIKSKRFFTLMMTLMKIYRPRN